MPNTPARLSKSVFSADVVVRTSHRYSGECYVSIRSVDEEWQIDLSPKADGNLPPDVAKAFENDALDELLRDQVRAQTRGIAEILLQTALRGSGVKE